MIARFPLALWLALAPALAARAQTYESSSHARDNLHARQAFDGDVATRWSAGFKDKTGWIQVTYATPQRHSEVTLVSGVKDLKGAPRDFDVLAGPSPTELALVKSVRGLTQDGVKTTFDGRSAKVWRIDVQARISEAWSPTISEVRFGPAAPPPDVGSGARDAEKPARTFSASDPGEAGSAPERAFDGDPATRYQAASEQKEAWLAVSYATPQTFDAARFFVRSEGGRGVARDFAIQTKSGSSWATVAKVQESYTVAPALRFKPTTAKDWRLLATALVAEKGGLQIGELELASLGGGDWPAGPALAAPTQTEVNGAIERGAAWLLGQRDQATGNWQTRHTGEYAMGVMALGGLALRKSGIEPEQAPHPELIERLAKLEVAKEKTYSVALYAVYLRALSAKKHVDRIKECADFLIRHQGPDGLWGYPDGRTDLSNAQFALLGLKAAVEVGIDVPAKVWAKSLDYLLSGAEKDGGFNYVPTGKAAGDPATGSMTAAALAGLKLCVDFLPKEARAEAQSKGVRDRAFEWLEKRFVVEMNPGSDQSHYYYLYAVERLGGFYERREIGGVSWYALGARHLLDWQKKDGSWRSGNVEDTCFALLFLNRASVSAK
jgi:hypothetical protein